jgi:hypothetical protein
MNEPEERVVVHRVKTPRFWLELEGRRAPWGEELRGSLGLEAETGPQRIVRASVMLRQGASPLAEVEILAHYTLRAGYMVQEGFALPVQWGTELGAATVSARVQAGALWAHSLDADVEIAPPVACARIASALEAMSGLKVRSWSVLAAGDAIEAHLAAEETATEFDGVRLVLFRGRGGGVLYGEMEIDLKADLARSLLGADRHRLQVSFDPRDMEGTRRRLDEILTSMRRRVGPEKDLPIPASSTDPDRESLPLPGADPNDPGRPRKR